MTIYWILWLKIIFANFLGVKKHLNKKILFLFILALFFIVGWRWEVGGDWSNYLHIFVKISYLSVWEGLIQTDPAYGLLNKMSAYLGYDIVFVNVVCAAIALYGVYFLARRLPYPWIVLLLMYPYTILVVYMGYTRQGVALGLVMLASAYAINFKKYKYFFWVVVACLFHKSALIMFIFYPLVAGYRFVNKSWRFYLYVFFVFMAILLLFVSIEDDNLYLTDQVFSAGVFPRFAAHLLPVFIYLLNRKKIKNNSPAFIAILDLMLYLIVLLFITAFYYSTIADRFNLYLILFDILVVVFFLSMLNYQSRLLLIFMIVVMNTASLYIWLNYSPWAQCCWQNYQNYLFL